VNINLRIQDASPSSSMIILTAWLMIREKTHVANPVAITRALKRGKVENSL
jgi:hypothetical protein